MRIPRFSGILLCFVMQISHGQSIPNRLIDYPAFLTSAQQVQAVRAARRLPEDQFLQAMSEPGVVLLDARSVAKFKLR